MTSPLPKARLSFSHTEDANKQINNNNNSKSSKINDQTLSTPITSSNIASNAVGSIAMQMNDDKMMKIKLINKPSIKLKSNKINEIQQHQQQQQQRSLVKSKVQYYSQQYQQQQQPASEVINQEANVSVYLRIRPTLSSLGQNASDTSGNTLIPVSATEVETIAPLHSQAFKNRKNDKKYAFTKVFSPDSTQLDVFNHTTKRIVDDFVNGKDGLLFTYGVTNSGKTYTIEGTQQQPGIIPRVLESLFERQEFNSNINSNKIIKVSYLQVYNEQIYDLQESTTDPIGIQSSRSFRDDMSEWSISTTSSFHGVGGSAISQKKSLKIMTLDERTLVENLKSTEIKSIDDGLRILSNGRALRETQETALNSLSSRSHSAYILEIYEREAVRLTEEEDEAIEPKEVLKNRLFIVDLAGSERGKRTNASGIRQKEATNINLSLMILDRCLETIRDNQKMLKEHPERKPMRVPYRDSTLTMLFRECFTSYNNISMIVCASSHPQDFDETLCALEYGALTKDINIIHQKISTKMTSNSLQSTPGISKIPSISRSNKNKQDAVAIALKSKAATQISNDASAANSTGFSQTDPRDEIMEQARVDIDEALDEILRLQEEVEVLKYRNEKLEEEVRAEVTNEMAARIIELDQIYQRRLEEATMIGEEKAKLMTENIKRRNTEKKVAQLQVQAQIQTQTPNPKRTTLVSSHKAVDFEEMFGESKKKQDVDHNVEQSDNDANSKQIRNSNQYDMESEIAALRQALVDKDTEIQLLRTAYTNQIYALNEQVDSLKTELYELKCSSDAVDDDSYLKSAMAEITKRGVRSALNKSQTTEQKRLKKQRSGDESYDVSELENSVASFNRSEMTINGEPKSKKKKNVVQELKQQNLLDSFI